MLSVCGVCVLARRWGEMVGSHWRRAWLPRIIKRTKLNTRMEEWDHCIILPESSSICVYQILKMWLKVICLIYCLYESIFSFVCYHFNRHFQLSRRYTLIYYHRTFQNPKSYFRLELSIALNIFHSLFIEF